MKKMLMVFFGVMLMVSLVGCGSSEKEVGKKVADVTYKFFEEKAEKKGESEPIFDVRNSNVTVYADEGAYFIALKKMEEGKRGKFVYDDLYKVNKHKDNKYSVSDVSDTNPNDVDLDSLSIIYETKNVEIK